MIKKLHFWEIKKFTAVIFSIEHWNNFDTKTVFSDTNLWFRSREWTQYKFTENYKEPIYARVHSQHIHWRLEKWSVRYRSNARKVNWSVLPNGKLHGRLCGPVSKYDQSYASAATPQYDIRHYFNKQFYCKFICYTLVKQTSCAPLDRCIITLYKNKQ